MIPTVSVDRSNPYITAISVSLGYSTVGVALHNFLILLPFGFRRFRPWLSLRTMSWLWNHQLLCIGNKFLEILIYLKRLDCLADQIFLARIKLCLKVEDVKGRV
jgi:hypothetical protein